MNTLYLFESVPKYLKYLSDIGLKDNTLWVNKWIINSLKRYCLTKNIKIIDEEVIKRFYIDVFNFNIDDKLSAYQTVLRRPIIALIDFIKLGTIKVKYDKDKNVQIHNIVYKKMLKNYINNYIKKYTNNTDSSIKRKIRVISIFLNHLDSNNINSLNKLTSNDLIMYINNYMKSYDNTTKSCYCGILKEFLNWTYKNNFTSFNGITIFQNIRNLRQSVIADSFTEGEIKIILDSIDTTTPKGKHHYLIICLLVYYGLRANDIINLKFNNIDFEKNSISLIVSKTKSKLTLPLIDEVKFAMLDYIKNSRPKNTNDNEHIILNVNAPYRKYKIGGLSPIINMILDNSGIDLKNRIKGSRVFRHSLATNMINNNISLDKIAAVLDHKNTKTTSIYITRDKTHLRELTLEVPYE